jgi:hypothetical protein
MSLDDSTLGYLDELLTFDPHYGWGWCDGAQVSARVPDPFRVRLRWFWDSRGERRGGVAQVEERGHECDGKWFVFATRHVGTYNFTTAPPHCEVAIERERPHRPRPGEDVWLTNLNPTTDLFGWGVIRAPVWSWR